MMLDKKLQKIGACDSAVNWSKGKTPREAYDTCERGDWLLWIAQKNPDIPKATYVKIAIDVAESVLHLIPADEDRPRLAIEAAKRWLENPTEENRLAAAASAAAASADAAHAAVYAAVYAAAARADAAYAYAASAAAASAAYAYADIVRKYISYEELVFVLAAQTGKGE